MGDEWMDKLRDKCFGGEKRGIEEFLLIQLATNPQGIDLNSILPFILLGGRGGRSDKFALVLALIASQQAQAQAQATAGTSGTPVPPTNNMLPLLMLLLGDRDCDRERDRGEHHVFRSKVVEEEDDEEGLKPQ
jgi:hypothetical protein